MLPRLDFLLKATIAFLLLLLYLLVFGSAYAQGPREDSMTIYYQDDTPQHNCQETTLGSFIKHTLPNEWIPSWDMEALKAGAVTIRSFVFHPENSIDHVVGGKTFKCVKYGKLDHQPTGSTYLSTDAATDATNGIYMTYNSNFINAQMRADCGNPTDDWTGVYPYYPYLKGVLDPVTTASTIGPGISQFGSQRWATGNDPTPENMYHPPWEHYEQILAHYYTGIHIRDGSGNRLTPTHRWNPLIVNFGTPDNTPPIMCVGWPYTFTLTIQNTGTGNWGSPYKLSYRWLAGSTWINSPPGAGVSTGNVAPGDEVTLTLTITSLDTEYDALIIDMRDGNGVFFEGREQGRPWYALAIALGGAGASAQVGAAVYSPEYSGHRVELCKAFLAVVMKNYPPPPSLRLWLFNKYNNDKGVWVGDEQGSTYLWRGPYPLGSPPHDQVKANETDPFNKNVAWYAARDDPDGADRIWRSQDGGVTFAKTNFNATGVEVPDIFADKSLTGYVYTLANVNNNSYIYRSTNRGWSWGNGFFIGTSTNQRLGKATRGAVHPRNSEIVIVGGVGGGDYNYKATIWRSTHHGDGSWALVWTPSAAEFSRVNSIVAHSEGVVWYAATQGGSGARCMIAKSTDQGATWSSIKLSDKGIVCPEAVVDVAVDAMDVNGVVALVKDEGICYSADGGNTWAWSPSCQPGSSCNPWYTWRLRADPALPGTFWLVGENVGDNQGEGLFKSVDGGVNWTRVYPQPGSAWVASSCLAVSRVP